jgi:hypothetical protein
VMETGKVRVTIICSCCVQRLTPDASMEFEFTDLFFILRPGTTVGSAYCTSAIFNSALLKNCNLCYSGSPKVVA